MRKSHFTETQIIGMIKEQEGVGRRSGITIRSFSRDLECKLQTVECLTLVGTEGRSPVSARIVNALIGPIPGLVRSTR